VCSMYTSLVLVYHISPTSLHWKLCLHLCDIFLYWGTTGFASFAVRHGRTEARTRTTQPLACGFYPVRMTKGAQCIFARQRPLPCAVGKGNARHRSLSCATCDAWQRKGVDGRPSETASPALCRAPPTNTHDIEKKRKKARQVGACLGQATTTPSLAFGPPFPTPAAPLGPPLPHLGSSTRSSGRWELGPPHE
jgi:hypothetical protein